MSEKVVDSLITFLGFRTDLSPAEVYKNLMTRMTEIAKPLAVSITGLAASVAFFTTKTSRSTWETKQFADNLGQTFQKFQEYEYIMKTFGATSEEAKASFSTVADAARATGKSVEEYLIILSEQVKNIPERDRGRWLMEEVHDSRLVELIKKGSAAIKEAYADVKKTGLLFTDEELAATEEYNKLLNTVSATIQGVYQKVVMSVLPEISKLTKGIKDWIYENRELIKIRIVDFINGFVKGIRETVSFIKSAYEALKPFISKLFELVGAVTNADKVARIFQAVLSILTIVFTTKLTTGIIGFIVQVWDFIKAINVAIIATLKWTASLLLTPVGWIAAAVALVTSAIIYFTQSAAEADGVTLNWIDSLKIIGKAIFTGFLYPINLAIKGLQNLIELASYLPSLFGGDQWEGAKKVSDELKSWSESLEKANKYVTGAEKIQGYSTAYATQYDMSLKEKRMQEGKNPNAVEYYGPGGNPIGKLADENYVEKMKKMGMTLAEEQKYLRSQAGNTVNSSKINNTQNNTINVTVNGVGKDSRNIANEIAGRVKEKFETLDEYNKRVRASNMGAITPGNKVPIIA